MAQLQMIPSTSGRTGQACHLHAAVCRLISPPCSSFTADPRRLLQTPRHNSVRSRHTAVKPVAFKFLKQLGLKKPEFLPDFGLDKRKGVLDRFYTSFDAATLNELLSDSFSLSYRAPGSSAAYGKKDYISLVSGEVKQAIPDYTWAHATDGSKDKDGFCVVKVQATGKHTGKPYKPNDKLPAVEASGKKFLLSEETQMVCVEDGKVSKIEVLPSKGAGPLALYEALGGKVPASART